MVQTCIESKIELITPEIASKYLETKKINRRVSQDHINNLSKCMKNGEWKLTHQGIAFGLDDKGDEELYDGEQRLWAVVESGISVKMMVTRNLPKDVRGNIDSGIRVRSARDNLMIMGEEVLNATEVARLTVLERINKHHEHLSTNILRELAKHYEGGLTMSRIHLPPIRNNLGRTQIIAGFIYAYALNPNAITAAADAYMAGADLPITSPILLLRNFAGSIKGIHWANLDVFMKTLYALNAYLYRAECKVLRIDKTWGVLRKFAIANMDEKTLKWIAAQIKEQETRD